MIYKYFKNTKKYNSFGLIFFAAIIVAVSFIFAFNGLEFSEQDTWQNYATFDFEQKIEYDEKGNEIAIKYISTPEQLAGAILRTENTTNQVYADDWSSSTDSAGTNKYKLSNDINLSGKSWSISNLGSSSNTSVELDGNGFTIKNLSINAGTGTSGIGFIGANYGKIKNLFFSNISVTTSKTTDINLGGVVGQNCGTLDNVCVMSGNVYGKSGKYASRLVGGIAGVNSGTIINCTNRASVYNGSHIGGICGANYGTVTKSYNHGYIKTNQNEATRLGGIVGECNSSGTIKLCLNFGNVYNFDYSDTAAVGGIVGYCYTDVEQCGNYGDVTGGGNWSTPESFVGGVVGYMKAKILNCYNLGNIKAYAKSTTLSKAVTDTLEQKEIGYYNWYGFLWITHHESHFYRTITFKSSSDWEVNAYAGGIVGYTTSTIENCYSKGDVYGGYTYRNSVVNVHIWRTGEGASDANFDVKSTGISVKFNSLCGYGSLQTYGSGKNKTTSNCYYNGTLNSEKGTMSQIKDANVLDCPDSYKNDVKWYGSDVPVDTAFTNGIKFSVSGTKLSIKKGEYYDPPNVKGQNRPPYYRSTGDTSCIVANTRYSPTAQGTSSSPTSINLTSAGWDTNIWAKGDKNDNMPYFKDLYW